MKKIERLDTEVKIGKIIDEDGELRLVEVDKDENELLRPYVDKEYVQFVVKYSKEI